MSSLTNKEELGLRCCVLFSDFQFHQHLTSYILLIEEFLSEKKSGKEFETQFYHMHDLDGHVDIQWDEFFDLISNFKITDFNGLSRLMSELFVACDSFESDCELMDEDDITEEELRCRVSEIFFKIKSRYVNS